MKKPLPEEILLAAMLVIQVTLVCAGVVSRTVGGSLSFTEELSRYLLVWLACLGFSACTARGEAIGFLWPWKKSDPLRRVLDILRRCVSAGFFLLLFYSSSQLVWMQWQFGRKTSVMGWPIVWVSAALPLACLLIGYRMFFPRREE